MASKKRKRKNAIAVDFYGTSELLQKIEKAGGNLEKIVSDAVVASAVYPRREMEAFMSQHRVSGQTAASMTETPINWKKGKLTYRVGYDVKKGGLPAAYLEVGTQSMKPHFFIKRALENNLSKIKVAQEEALQKAFEELL